MLQEVRVCHTWTMSTKGKRRKAASMPACSRRAAAFVATRLASVVWTFCVAIAPSVSPQKGLLWKYVDARKKFEKGASLGLQSTFTEWIEKCDIAIAAGGEENLGGEEQPAGRVDTVHLVDRSKDDYLALNYRTALNTGDMKSMQKIEDLMAILYEFVRRGRRRNCIYTWSGHEGIEVLRY
ncbi:hypothetical protein Vadar_011791 [Vaccinium darrowii]|uniref:Uncharacterized protein n=1 Tax=Vaccinium darrowii TaxID=229202 RepID=A0ACB7ZJP7_9ERIC|nr:hypothetical protein Vadar_011791 [Vaccinium darrowii]